MIDSIMQEEKKCYITGSVTDLHKHHCFDGCRRKASDKWGCWVWLRSDYHNMSDHGVHFDSELDMRLKRETQKRFERLYGHNKFMQVFGKNYL
jgi:hypothetical protein